MKALEENQKTFARIPMLGQVTYAQLVAGITTSLQRAVYEEACHYMQDRVVDCGCGSAKLAPLLVEKATVSAYTGVDCAADMVAEARLVLEALQQPQFTVVQSSIEAYEGSFDSAVSIQGYSAWSEPLVTLAHIRKLLVKNGTLVLAVANKNWPKQLPSLIRESERELINHPYFAAYRDYQFSLAFDPDTQFIVMDDLIKQCQRVGFRVEACHQRHFQGSLNFLILKKN